MNYLRVGDGVYVNAEYECPVATHTEASIQLLIGYDGKPCRVPVIEMVEIGAHGGCLVSSVAQ